MVAPGVVISKSPIQEAARVYLTIEEDNTGELKAGFRCGGTSETTQPLGGCPLRVGKKHNPYVLALGARRETGDKYTARLGQIALLHFYRIRSGWNCKMELLEFDNISDTLTTFGWIS